jgi:hypothetical protein
MNILYRNVYTLYIVYCIVYIENMYTADPVSANDCLEFGILCIMWGNLSGIFPW